MRSELTDRRSFLATAGRLGLLGLLAPLGLVGCGGDEEKASGGDTAEKAPVAAAPTEDASCDDVSGLTEDQIEVRRSFEYVETAPDPAEACKICAYWEEPAASRTCGGCMLFAGPVHPNGTCNTFEEA